MNKTLQIGKINALEVSRSSDYGLFLKAKDGSEVLLPNAYVKSDEMDIGELVNVFLYTDSEDRIVATTERPKAMLGEYGYFRVVSYKQYGAFVDWGLPKDLFVPLSEQKEYFHVDDWFVLRVCLDEQTGRLYGTQKIGKWLSNDTRGLFPMQEVDMFVIAKTPLGYKVVVNNLFEGMLFDNEIFEPISIGDQKNGVIKTIRKDGKLDCLLKSVKLNQDDASQKVLDILKSHGGTVLCTYKSDASLISDIFGMSKKVFKRTLTELINKDKITLHEDKIIIN
ncbi:MAG: S1-like domain-containing RNA-binding protein [Sulfurovaceae bacterium]|nr:S1-like domain-containing RNA-binding protein [Sulfurovaceae bacterium]